MTATDNPLTSVLKGIRIALIISGVLTLIAGVLILWQPAAAAAAVTAIAAAYAIAAGAVYVWIGFASKTIHGWMRVGHIALGVLFVIAGIVAFMNLGQTAAWLAVFVTIMIGIMWIFEGVGSLTTLKSATSKTWTVIFAIVSIIAGISLVVAPLVGAVTLWWLLGVMLIVLGVIQVVRGIMMKPADVADEVSAERQAAEDAPLA